MELGAVIAARNAVPYRPAWVGIFAKACALTAREYPELRRTYVKWPWPHLYEYGDSIATITINREHNGEACVLPLLIAEAGVAADQPDRHDDRRITCSCR